MKLFQVDTLEQAQKKLLDSLGAFSAKTESISLLDANGRILAEDIHSEESLPPFHRSTVDGYAVRAKDTFGAGESLASFFLLAGAVEMGQPCCFSLQPGQAAYIPTGGMLPADADAVVMVEYTELLGANEIAVYRAVAPGENVMRKGEDICPNDVALQRGTLLRPQDVGVLAALGKNRVSVIQKPTISILSTGDEIIEPHEPLSFGKIRDINRYALITLARESGATVVSHGLVPDQRPKIQAALTESLANADIVVLSGGSSMGEKDMTAEIINELGSPGVLTHGLSIQPGKPTILGVIDGKTVIGLPGNPVAAIMVFRLIIAPLIAATAGQKTDLPLPVHAELTANVPSSGGRRQYQMVNVHRIDGKTVATPLWGKSGAITLLSKASGYIIIPENSEGALRGSQQDVFLFYHC